MRLLLVYNADAGLFNAITDTAHKILAPATYTCRLCLHTYGTFGMRRPWKDFLERLDVPVAFYHRDEFRSVYDRRDLALPAILADHGDRLEVLVSAAEINAAEGLDDLKDMLHAALARTEVA